MYPTSNVNQWLIHDYLQVERDHEEDRQAGAGVDVPAHILIVEGDVDPGACAC